MMPLSALRQSTKGIGKKFIMVHKESFDSLNDIKKIHQTAVKKTR